MDEVELIAAFGLAQGDPATLSKTTARNVVFEIVADLTHLTPPQLRDLGRRALTA